MGRFPLAGSMAVDASSVDAIPVNTAGIATGDVLRYDGTNLEPHAYLAGIFGDGSTGAATIGNDTFTGPRFYADLTINAAATVQLRNWPLFVSGTLTIGDNVTIH